jgi:hypothetical protein
MKMFVKEMLMWKFQQRHLMAKIYKGLNLDCLYAWGYSHLEKDSVLHNNYRQRRRINVAVLSYVEVTTINPLQPKSHVQCPLTFKNTFMLLLSEGRAVEARKPLK